ncbi:MAG TPA: glycosyltransferase, partial [Chitinophagaceae bacterium]
MNIAVNTRFLMKDHLEGVGYFIKEVFGRIASAHPEHQFYFLFDRPHAANLHFPANVTPVVIGPPARHPLLWKYWFDVKVPSVLRKVKADLFVSTDGFCSLATRVPQLLLVHDLGFLHYPAAYKKSNMLFYKTYTPRFLKKAKHIATVSEYTRQDLVGQYAIDPNKIGVVYSAVKPSFHPLAEEEKNRVKDQYTGGNEYFIYAGAIQPRKNLVNLLKAFSLYKK